MNLVRCDVAGCNSTIEHKFDYNSPVPRGWAMLTVWVPVLSDPQSVGSLQTMENSLDAMDRANPAVAKAMRCFLQMGIEEVAKQTRMRQVSVVMCSEHKIPWVFERGSEIDALPQVRIAS